MKPTESRLAATPSPAGTAWYATVKAVAWSFFGVRNQAGKEDTALLKPLPLIAVGIGACFVFVLGLAGLVKWVVAP
jgi:hypothetical protein